MQEYGEDDEGSEEHVVQGAPAVPAVPSLEPVQRRPLPACVDTAGPSTTQFKLPAPQLSDDDDELPQRYAWQKGGGACV